MVIAPPTHSKVKATMSIDFRKGENRLAAPIKDEMGADPFSDVLYVFRAKRAGQIKNLHGLARGKSW